MVDSVTLNIVTKFRKSLLCEIDHSSYYFTLLVGTDQTLCQVRCMCCANFDRLLIENFLKNRQYKNKIVIHCECGLLFIQHAENA